MAVMVTREKKPGKEARLGRDLRGWIEEADRLGELKTLHGAGWDIAIGAVTELRHHRGERSHALLFDNIKGHPPGYRVLSNTLNTVKRIAMTLHMDTNYSRMEFVKETNCHTSTINKIKTEGFQDGTGTHNGFEDQNRE